jgi:hypothetical protein
MDTKNDAYYEMLKEKFVDYWAQNHLETADGTILSKAFLAYVKGFVDGLDYVDEIKQSKKIK